MINKLKALFAGLVLMTSCGENNAPVTDEPEEKLIKPISSYFPPARAQVLVVGSSHFDYPGLDAMKADESDKIDVLEEPKKSEVTELVEYLKKLNANKIAIEAHPEWNAALKYGEYKAGDHRERTCCYPKTNFRDVP